MMMQRLYRVLLEDWDMNDAAYNAEDWRQDAKAVGLDVGVSWTLFRLVDVWSSGLDVSYCAFLRNLFDKTTVAVTEIDPLTGSSARCIYLERRTRMHV